MDPFALEVDTNNFSLIAGQIVQFDGTALATVLVSGDLIFSAPQCLPLC